MTIVTGSKGLIDLLLISNQPSLFQKCRIAQFIFYWRLWQLTVESCITNQYLSVGQHHEVGGGGGGDLHGLYTKNCQYKRTLPIFHHDLQNLCNKVLAYCLKQFQRIKHTSWECKNILTLFWYSDLVFLFPYGMGNNVKSFQREAQGTFSS